jgi:hypothetical protein
LKVLYEKYDKEKNIITNVYHTFRDAISSTSRQQYFFENCLYKNNEYIGVCDLCKINSKVVIDHYENSFQKILDNFLLENNVILSNIIVMEIDNIYEFVDKEFQQKWIKYHDTHAKYRLLCNSCNCSMGSNSCTFY